MKLSDWLSVGALLVAALALVLGEWRARRSFRADKERNLVEWSISWPEKGAFVLTNDGPDVAEDVWIQITAHGKVSEASSKLLRRHAILEIPVPQLAEDWDRTKWKAEAPGLERVNVVTYGGQVTWRSPAGTPHHRRLDSAIQNWRKIDLQIY